MNNEPLYSYYAQHRDNLLCIYNSEYDKSLYGEDFKMCMKTDNILILNKYLDFIYTDLSSKVTELNLEIKNNDNINLNLLPSKLQILRILVWEHGRNAIFKTTLDYLPLTLEHLVITVDNLKVSLDNLPISLKRLGIHINNHKEFLDTYGLNNLPQSLTVLDMSYRYWPNDKLTSDYLIEKCLNLPKNIEHFHTSKQLFKSSSYISNISVFEKFLQSKYGKLQFHLYEYR